ncbi:MAG: hypothetical protein ACOCMW_00985 [Campylobacter hyointestinalis]
MSFGFDKTSDIFPNFYSKLCLEDRLKIFLSLYNCFVGDELKIPNKYAKYSKSISDIFTKRIDDLLYKNKFSVKKCISFCFTSNAIINAYLNGKKLPVFANEPKMKVAKLIKSVYKNGDFYLNLDAQILFFNYVFDKIKRRHPDKQIDIKDNLLILKSDGKGILGVLPIFKEISFERKDELTEEIDIAKSMESMGLDLYIVFPRHFKFTKHIEVKGCFRSGTRLKLVPYSVCNKIYNKGKR